MICLTHSEFLFVALVIGWAAFALGVWLQRRDDAHELDYQRRSAGMWFDECQRQREFQNDD